MATQSKLVFECSSTITVKWADSRCWLDCLVHFLHAYRHHGNVRCADNQCPDERVQDAVEHALACLGAGIFLFFSWVSVSFVPIYVKVVTAYGCVART